MTRVTDFNPRWTAKPLLDQCLYGKLFEAQTNQKEQAGAKRLLIGECCSLEGNRP
jgi:hypothetical protein